MHYPFRICSSQEDSLLSRYGVFNATRSEGICITKIISSDVSRLGRSVGTCVCSQKLRTLMVTHTQEGLVTTSLFEQNTASYLLSDLKHHTNIQFTNTSKHTEIDLYHNIWCHH